LKHGSELVDLLFEPTVEVVIEGIEGEIVTRLPVPAIKREQGAGPHRESGRRTIVDDIVDEHGLCPVYID
jgi:hypothetical protein